MSTEPLAIDATVSLPADELSWTAVRSSGPGGQHVNKVSSRIELRFALDRSQALSESVKARLREIAKSYLLADGSLLIKSDRTRERLMNLGDAREKLRALVAAALVVPKLRKKTRPTLGSKRRRLDDKRRTAEKKQGRRPGSDG